MHLPVDRSASAPAARRAVAAVFFTNGAVMGAWAPMIPVVQARLGLAPGPLGLCLLALAVGAIVAMQLSGAWCGRHGSAPVVRISTWAVCTTLVAPVLAASPVLLFVGLLVLGAANGLMDVSMNAHGIAVEKALGRPVMSSYHAMYSLGGFTGALGSATLLRALPPAGVAATVAAVFVAISAWSLTRLLPADVDRGMAGDTPWALPSGVALALGALCFLVMMGEGSMLDWTALYLRQTLAADPAVAGLGYSAFSVAMAAGRFAGDGLRRRVGAPLLVTTCAALAAGGLFLACVSSRPTLAVVAFGLCGLGLSNAVPVLFSAAGSLPGQGAGSGVAAVATLGYAGFLIGPPLIGFAAQAFSLRVGLGLVALGCLAVALTARRVVRV